MALAQDFSSLLGPAVTEIDRAMVSVQASQDSLGKEIDRMIADLELFTEIATPPKLQASLEKLQDAKKRILMSAKLMEKITQRVEKIQRELDNIKDLLKERIVLMIQFVCLHSIQQSFLRR
ncbi:hypothetical protein EDC96DRAFT_550120 [Choanephora cucurbitarum]|nr:hypothetical protein EDC96DRAFT_550120 [Choanephora cucurbitarum]